MKKKILSIILAAAMVLGMAAFTGCGNSEDETALANSTGWPEGSEDGFIQVEGGRVLYHLYGKDKTGIPIIFLHGGPGGSCACFYKQSELGENHPVVMFNQLGNNGSDYTEGTTLEQAQELMTIDNYVDQVQAVVDYFGFDEFMIVGRSWGTMLAVEYAAAKQPEGLKGIILDGPFLNVDTWCEDAERLIKSLPEQDVCGEQMDGNEMWEVIRECEEAGTYNEDERYAAINKIYSGNFNSRFENEELVGESPSDAEVTEYTIEGLSVYNYMWGPSEFTCTGTLKGHDSTALLKEIEVPILYVCGEYDSGTPEAAYKYESMSNDAEVTVIGGCAHNASRERGTEFNAIIEGFADRISQ